jgi:hypothetical protein
MYTPKDREEFHAMARKAWDAVAVLFGFHSLHHCGCRHCERLSRILAAMDAELEQLAGTCDKNRRLSDGDPWSQIEAN